MIKIEDLATIVENRLNALATSGSLPFAFKIYASEGDYVDERDNGQRKLPTPIIDGMLTTFPSTIIPLATVKSYTISQQLTILAPVEVNADGITFAQVMGVAQAFVEKIAGWGGNFTDNGNTVAGIVSPQLPDVGIENNELGEYFIPISIFLTWQFIESGVVSNAVKIYINDTEITVLEGGFERTRIPETVNLKNASDMTSVILQQGLTLRIVTPYLNTQLCKTLMSNILLGALDDQFNVKYNDGIIPSTIDLGQMTAVGYKVGYSAGMPVNIEVVLTKKLTL